MEEDEIQAQQARKFQRVHQNGRNNNNNDSNNKEGSEINNNSNRFHNWNHHSSRIVRVSRASGGKDRHSKVMTSKGLRDRRVRLSVTTAIQFYDLQDRLGYDQPSKAVEWLIKSASDAIAELPSLNNTFPDSSKQDEKGVDSGEVDGDGNYHQQRENLSLSKSACSSTSETSKGSGLSLSRSDIRVNRVKARERARERAAKEKEKEKENESHIAQHQHQHQNLSPISQTASFTELLTGGPDSRHQHQQQQQWCSSAPMDYFTSGLLGASSSSSRPLHQIQLGHSTLAEAMSISPFHVTSTSSGDHHQNHPSSDHHFSFIPDHLMQPVVVTSSSASPSAVVVSQSGAGNNNEYNLNFTISSGLSAAAGSYNRGTLQSNSNSTPSMILPHLQRFSSPLDGSSSTVPFFIGATAPAPNSMENNHHHYHQFSSVFDGRFQLYHGDAHRHSTDHKGKTKN